MAEQMRYRHYEHKHVNGKVSDIFDGEIYQQLKDTFVTINEEEMHYKYFSDFHDIALGLSTDGFGPHKRRNKTAWPLILFNYNLPPEIRFHKAHIIPLGVIPGPRKPHDIDSFLLPLVQELMQLLLGISAYDAYQGGLFRLRAYLLLVFGDIPAVSLVMKMKGHNGTSPCRMCNIIGIRVPNVRATAHYVPLDRSHHPLAIPEAAIKAYNPAELPLRSHNDFVSTAKSVDNAETNAQANDLAKQSGIKGLSILASVPSLIFPQSFPYDFMHLIWENLIKNLILLWTDEFKDLDEGTGEYVIAKKAWEEIGKATASAGSTIPSSYSGRLSNIASDRSYFTADNYSFWTLYIAPILLRHRFRQVKYYEHFIDLVDLLNCCLQFEMTEEDVEKVRLGFIKWVKDYEE